MPEKDHDFLAPGDLHKSRPREPESQRMTNADFRKMMMTPRASGASDPAATPILGGGAVPSMTPARGGALGGGAAGGKTPSKNAQERKQKKSFYAKIKREEDDKMAELASKYRDRAKERRDGDTRGPVAAMEGDEEDQEAANEREQRKAEAEATSGYRAVAPDLKSSYDAAERRKRMIQESKYLGGDMEHTHLVKGLDFALLQKVRSEIVNREHAAEAEDGEGGEAGEDAKESESKTGDGDPITELIQSSRTNMGKNIVRTLFKPDLPKQNELFHPGRMAYVMDLEEDFGQESDIPTTTIRSKADMEANPQLRVTLSTNDIVINKLTQILSYLRQGTRGKKKKKDKALREEMEEITRANEKIAKAKAAAASMPIYDDLDDYVPDHRRRGDRDRDRDRDRRRDRDRDDRRSDRDRRDRDRGGDRRGGGDRDRDRRRRDEDYDDRRDRRDRDDKRGSYFDKREDDEEDYNEGKRGFSREDKDFIRRLAEKENEKEKQKKAAAKGGMGLADDDAYAECYPGLEEMNDACDDSDEEADFSKMDLGSKKGPVGRWDFDTPEEYSDYMSKKEALPKAAFQYGVKMNAGRKTRGKIGTGAEKNKLNQEWNKISSMIEKRKGEKGGGGSKAKAARTE